MKSESNIKCVENEIECSRYNQMGARARAKRKLFLCPLVGKSCEKKAKGADNVEIFKSLNHDF